MDTDNALLDSLGCGPEEMLAALPAAVPVADTSKSNHTGVTTSVEDRALELLGSGITPEQAAAALGVTASRISQLLAEEVFASKVADRRYQSLQAHNTRDGKYDTLEDSLIGKLERSLPMLIKPESILKAMQIVNSAKRRGQSAPQQVTNQQTVVTLNMPQVVVQKFAVDVNNQVIKAGEQDLVTMPSGNLLKQVEEAEALRIAAHIEQGGRLA